MRIRIIDDKTEDCRLTTFSLLTFNIFGVPAPGTGRRLEMLASILNREPFTAVCLQEVQSHQYRRLLIQSCSSYRGRAYEPFVHAPKGGLLTLARLPIRSHDFVLYNERGLWYTPAVADWILHKGVLITRLEQGDLPVVVLNTHLTANYTGDWRRGKPYAEHEFHQLEQLAQIVQEQPRSALVIVCGDFNIPRGSWLYDSFLGMSGLVDPLDGNPEPTYRPHSILPAGRYAMAIDYALVRPPSLGLPGLRIESRQRFQEKIGENGRALYLSDHNAIELRLSWDAVEDRQIIAPGAKQDLRWS